MSFEPMYTYGGKFVLFGENPVFQKDNRISSAISTPHNLQYSLAKAKNIYKIIKDYKRISSYLY